MFRIGKCAMVLVNGMPIATAQRRRPRFSKVNDATDAHVASKCRTIQWLDFLWILEIVLCIP